MGIGEIMTLLKGLSRKWTVLLLLLPNLCLAQGAHRISQVLIRGNGIAANVGPNAAITVCSPGTHCGTVATIYSDLNLTQVLKQPLIADASGNYSYYVPTGCYDEKVSIVGSQPLLTFNVCLISSVAGSGSVTNVSVVTANGFQGTVANSTTTPSITISPDSTHYFPTLTDEANWNAKAPTASPTFTGTATVNNLTITGTCTGCGGGGGAVSSVFGRTGAVTAQTGDYSLANISAGAAPTGLFDFSAATQLKLPSHAGYTAAASGELGYDTTNLNVHFNVASTDLIMLGVPSASLPTNGHCAQFTQIGAWYELTDAGAACGSGGGGSGTVTSVSVTTANGVSASVSNPTTTPALTFTLGAITPTQVTTGFVTTTGNAACTGCGGGDTLTEGVAPSGSFIGAGLDTYWADSASHHIAANLNAGGTSYIPVGPGSIPAGDVLIAASNGYDIADGGAPPGTGITNGTAGFVGLFGSATTINATSPIDCGITTASVCTSSEPVAVGDSGGTLSHSIIINPANGVAPSVTTGAWTLAMATAAITGQTWVPPSAPCTGSLTATNASGIMSISCGTPVTITTGTTATLTPGLTVNHEATASTAVAYTLPTAASGINICAENGYNGSAATTGVLTLNTSASGQFLIDLSGVLSASGGHLTSNGAAANMVCVTGIDSTHWQVDSINGTWTTH